MALLRASRRCSGAVLLLSFASLLAFAAAQSDATINYDDLPACAKSCQKLTQALDACTPPQAEASDFTTYESCFCQSGYLTAWASGTTSGVCDSECSSQSDLTTLQEWYSSACQAGNALEATDGQATSSTTSAAPAATSSSSSSSGGSSGSNSGSSSSSSSSNSGPSGSWISTHWQWILMLIIVFLAMVFFSVLGVWLKRRHRRRQDQRRTNVAASDAALAAPPPMNGHLPGHPIANIPPMSAVPPSHAMAGSHRSGTPTLASVRNSSGTLDRYSNQQVAWGPHQHQAATQGWHYEDPEMMPPSPTVGSLRGKERMSGAQGMPQEEMSSGYRGVDGPSTSGTPPPDRRRTLRKQPSAYSGDR